MILQVNGIQRKSGVAGLISDKTDFKIKKARRGKYGYFIIIKGIINQEDIALINLSAPKLGAAKMYKIITNRHKGRKWQKHNYSRGLNTPLTARDRSSKQKVNKETLALNDALDEMDIINVYRVYIPKSQTYIFLKCISKLSAGAQN